MLQIISNRKFSRELVHGGGITVSPLSAPRAMDDFAINILDLADESLWYYRGNQAVRVNEQANLISLRQIIYNTAQSKLVIVLPQNCPFVFDYGFSSAYGGDRYRSSEEIKNILPAFVNILEKATGVSLSPGTLLFEKTTTQLGSLKYAADFSLVTDEGVKTRSTPSGKATTVLREGRLLTTLDILETREKLDEFLRAIGLLQDKPIYPQWLLDYDAFDDAAQRSAIAQRQIQINQLELENAASKEKLAKNLRLKSILYTNGDDLVRLVYEILEALLDCDLSGFVDEKKEDFLIQKPSVTFVGEIKGVTSNVRSEHVAQVDTHCQGYLDRLEETGKKERVKPLLIISPLRTTPPPEREPVHEIQIALARRNGCLIVETAALLRVYEFLSRGLVTPERCIQVLSVSEGLLRAEDLLNGGPHCDYTV